MPHEYFSIRWIQYIDPLIECAKTPADVSMRAFRDRAHGPAIGCGTGVPCASLCRFVIMSPQRSERRRQCIPERGAVEGKVEATPYRISIVLLVDVIFRPRVHPRLDVLLIGPVGYQAKLTRQPVVR